MAGAGAPSREKAKALARPAGAAEDTGAAAALDGRSARKGQASPAERGAQAADTAAGGTRQTSAIARRPSSRTFFCKGAGYAGQAGFA